MSAFSIKFCNWILTIVFGLITFLTFFMLGAVPPSFEWMVVIPALAAYGSWGIIAGFWYLLRKLVEDKAAIKSVDTDVLTVA
jgi:hypothetical protein